MHTQYLALVFSIYMMIAGLKILSEPAWYMDVIRSLRDSTGLCFLAGAFVYFFGAGLLVLHHALETPLEIAVTAFAGLMALEGAMIMIAPTLILSLPAGIGFQHHSRAWGIFAFALGAALGIAALV